MSRRTAKHFLEGMKMKNVTETSMTEAGKALAAEHSVSTY